MRERLQLLCALLVAMLLLTAGCAPRVTLEDVRATVAGGQGHLITTVPFIPQEEYQCGPASLAMVLQYYGSAVGQDEIARAIYLPSVRGTLNLDLAFYARRRGFQARSFAGTLEGAKEQVRRDRPLIVFQDLGFAAFPVPHFAVLVGYDDRTRTVVLHSGTTAYRVVSYDEFERTWARRRAWTLLITPRGESVTTRSELDNSAPPHSDGILARVRVAGDAGMTGGSGPCGSAGLGLSGYC